MAEGTGAARSFVLIPYKGSDYTGIRNKRISLWSLLMTSCIFSLSPEANDSEEKGMAGWDKLMDIVTSWRNAGFNRLANGGIGTTGVTPSEPGQATSPVQARRPGS